MRTESMVPDSIMADLREEIVSRSTMLLSECTTSPNALCNPTLVIAEWLFPTEWVDDMTIDLWGAAKPDLTSQLANSIYGQLHGLSNWHMHHIEYIVRDEDDSTYALRLIMPLCFRLGRDA